MKRSSQGSRERAMSQVFSDRAEEWRCSNPDCIPVGNHTFIPLSIGRKFQQCPFCQTKQVTIPAAGGRGRMECGPKLLLGSDKVLVHGTSNVSKSTSGSKSKVPKKTTDTQHEGLSEEWLTTCVSALSKFRAVCAQVQTSQVTVLDLHEMSTNKELVKRMCKAVEDKEFSYSSLSTSLDQRNRELQFFQKRRQAYLSICNWIPDPRKVKGLSSLKDELKKIINNKKICELCQFQDGSLVVLCYQAAKSLDPFVDHFDIMMNKSSILFLHPLNKQFNRTVATKSGLTLAHIYPEIWQPVFDGCRKLVDSLVDQSITLSAVDTFLKNYCDNLDSNVYNLAVGLAKCLNLTVNSSQLQRSLQNIRQYWKLCEFRAGAQILLDLRNVLKLKGDFMLVESVSEQFSESKNQTLHLFNANVIDAGHFLDLEKIMKDLHKIKCLETFRDCQEIITWLKEFTKSVNDIQGFVTVALATAAGGEGDLAHDRLSHLRIVGSGFASLIYEVRESDDYKTLIERCKSLWETLDKNRNLPELLLSCNQDLEWYKQVKETQGSVEVTFYSQMILILKYGTYRVVFKKNTQTVDDLITVGLTQHYQKLNKTRYTLDELRDLKGKLLFICGSMSEAKAEVDHYLKLLHTATRIAKLYLDLQRAGDVTYTSAKLEFRCALYNGGKDPQFNEPFAKKRLDDLQDYIGKLDNWLVNWRNNVDTARGRFYELNYFTTHQLVELRRELCLGQQATTTGKTPILKPSVLMLLKSVSPHVSSSVVSQALDAAFRKAIVDDKWCNDNEDSSEQGDEKFSESEEVVSIPSWSARPAVISPEASPSTKPSVPSFEDLNEEQQRTYIYCTKFCGYSAGLVLRAFLECGPEAIMYDIEEWCECNGDSSFSEQGEQEFEVLTESEEEEFKDSDSEEVYNDDALGLFISVERQPSIRTIVRESIDGNHPDVQELVEAGYDPQAALEAMNRFRNVGRAMEYLDIQEETKGGEGMEFVRFISEEERMEPGPADEVDVECILEYLDNDHKSHLDLDQLGRVLQAINNKLPGAVCSQRPFDTNLLKIGLPNLLVTSADNVLWSVLALYTADPALPLPTLEEVLLCTDKTTTEEVTLLWRRAIGDPGHLRVFCLAHAERLSNQLCDAAVRSLIDLSQDRNDYRLVVICSKEDKEKSLIFSHLHTFLRPVVPQLDEAMCREYLKAHFAQPTDIETSSQAPATQCIAASVVDPDRFCVRVISSTRSGMGKSLYIKRRGEELHQLTKNHDVHITIPIHGPVVTNDTLMEYFGEHTKRDVCAMYHLDIALEVLRELDYLLFSLLILKGFSDSRGCVWRTHSSQLYVVEVTCPEYIANDESFQTLSLLSLLPTIHCLSPKAVCEQEQLGSFELGMDGQEFKGTTIQRVYQYLKRDAGCLKLDTFSYCHGYVEGNVRDFLKIILSKCGIYDPSWLELHHFSKFLDIQLHSCESSVFCDETLVGDVMPGLKGLVVNFMIRMSRDFSTPSLVGLQEEDLVVKNQLGQYQIVKQRQWEHSSHPYIFFNEDHVCMTFIGFRVTQTGDLINPSTMAVTEQSIMSPQLYTGLMENGVNFEEDYRGWSKEQMITKIAAVMGYEFFYDPDDSYVLTTNNLVKMLAIQMRFRCDIPVVIMGETGCGKTRLIQYMCDLARHGRDLKNLLMLKIHGGITEQDICSFMEAAERIAQTNKTADPKLNTVAVFDMANTTKALGLIKEIMCDRRINRRAVSKDLKFIATCSPYRRHSEEMIERLEKAGVGLYAQVTGKIPSHQLVYRVLDLPPSMASLVYDFGQLSNATEKDYIFQIVKEHVQQHPGLYRETPAIIPAISTVLAASQQFMREQQNECSFVSLRDVERAMIVFEYFYEKMNLFAPIINNRAKKEFVEQCCIDSDDEEEEVIHPPLSNLTRALLLTLSVCYHARLHNREPYEEYISHTFTKPILLPNKTQQFRNEIRWCQEGLLDQMVLGPNIAKNAALRENVFVMVICIELRIPLFLAGISGSSKSLAKSIIQDSMHGRGSRSPVLREFKQFHLFTYQCSQLSTSESVIEMFKSAERFQANQDNNQYVSVVVLDGVGLAEDSPSLPLTTFHSLLEDGTDGSRYYHQAVEREKRVAFVGISNWPLNSAIMNRGIMVTRGASKLEELQHSARDICCTEYRSLVREQLQRYCDPLSRAFLKVCIKQSIQFFGLRDFYSLIKMLYWFCVKSEGLPLSARQLEYAIRRNFGGLKTETFDPIVMFMSEIDIAKDLVDMSEEVHIVMSPDYSTLGLIKASLTTKDTTWQGENRYLLLLSQNYAALDILKHYLNVESEDVITSQPHILFGSSFPKDKECTQVHLENLNQIKICMEVGRTVILLNLENLYDSLYDVLNQYYMHYGGERYMDLGLQTHRVKCRVHNNFKLILIAEKNTVYKKFPHPLINRLEKHIVLTSSVLEHWQHGVLSKFDDWIRAFSEIKDSRGNQFKRHHAFIGYQTDTPAVVIFQATNLLSRLVQKPWEQKCLDLQKIFSDDLSDLSIDDKESPQWSDAVFRLSQFLLLQTATDDALIRLQKSTLPQDEQQLFMNLYYKHQHHSSIREFLKYECGKDHEVFMQVTTHSPLLTLEELKTVTESLTMGFAHFDLYEFDTELDFSSKLSRKLQREETQAQPFLVVVQCDLRHLSCDLIACVRYRVCDEAIKAKFKNKIPGRNGITHILFVIRLSQQESKSQFIGFQGDPWISVHIDDLRPILKITVIREQVYTTRISEVFIGKFNRPTDSLSQVQFEGGVESQYCEENEMSFSGNKTDIFPKNKSLHAQYQRLLGCMQDAVSLLKNSEENRSMLTIQRLKALIPQSTLDRLDDESFYSLLANFIHQALRKREERVGDWMLMEAMNRRKVESGETFQNVLIKHIEEVITPLFAELIAHIDQYCNLSLLDPENQLTPISIFWLKMFRLIGGRILFSSFARRKTEIKINFPCRLPFSWFVREEVEAVRVNLPCTNTSHKLSAILEALGQTELGNILSTVSEQNVQELYERYLYDFVRYVHKSGNKGDLQEMEYKLILDTLDHQTNLFAINSVFLLHKIVALHVIYSQCSTEVLLFGQLVLHRPRILHSLISDATTNWDFTLHVRAVQKVLESDLEDDPNSQTLAGLSPPLYMQSDITQNIQHWVNHICLSQNVIDTILRSSVRTEATVRASMTWQRVRALQIFAEKVYVPNSSVKEILFMIRRLALILNRLSDFLKRETLDGVKQILNNMFKRIKMNQPAMKKITSDCNRFYIEVISSLCLGGQEAPEPDLVKALLDTVLYDTMKISRLSLRHDPAKIPIFHSFLLQFLLEKKRSQVEEHLRDYFDVSLGMVHPDQGLCLLCTQWFENALHKRVANHAETIAGLEGSYMYLMQHTIDSEHHVTLKYLQAVAGVRFGLSVVAELMKNGCIDDRLLHITQTLCVDRRVNVIDPTGRVDITGPVLYLLRFLVRQYGCPCLNTVCEDHPWVVPLELRRGKEEEKLIMDPFVLYGKEYTELRSYINSFVSTKKSSMVFANKKFSKSEYEPSLLSFALYQKVTLSQATRAPTKQVQNKALQTLNTLIRKYTGLHADMMHMLRLLLSNQQGGPLAQLTVSPHQSAHCRTLSGIVVHCVSVILCRAGVDLLLPLRNMLSNPTALVNAYLPTMAEDELKEVRNIGEAICECPNGHPNYVSKCGQPVEKCCKECGAKINIVNHAANRVAIVDASKTGYDLGLPDHRSVIAERERDLSAPAVCVIRVLMHSAFIWASCNNHDRLVDIAKVAKGLVTPSALPKFFWSHLERDLECLGRITGRGLDECAIIQHLVLQQILTTHPPTSPNVASVNQLQSKDARREWEKLFSETYIDSVLFKLNTTLRKALDVIGNDEQQDQLFYLAYEKVKVDESKLQAHLWTFRPQINLEHLKRDMQMSTSKDKTPVLEGFLQAEHSLCATQYLPDIVRLQCFLFDMYNKRLEKKEAESLTIRDFLKEVKGKFDVNTKNECQKRIESLRQAWALVSHRLKTHHRLPVNDQYLPAKITLTTPLVYLIPTTTGEGRCMTALVDYLAIAHNNFIEHCQSVVSEEVVSMWKQYTVPITHLHRSHMLEYEEQLQSIILSHCHYSLKVGKGQEIEYDLPALEKHILNRFVYCKPIIEVDIPIVTYHTTMELFLEIRRKVKPQVALDQRLQQDIVTELRTPDGLRKSLDVVDIVLGLLSSGGGPHTLSLKHFLDQQGMGRKVFSAEAKKYCTLGHIISLWETISVEVARQLWASGQEPFEAIPVGYNRKLEKNQRKELDQCLITRKFDLGLLLGVLFEYIEVYVKQITNDRKQDNLLVDAMVDYWSLTEQTAFTRFTTLKWFPPTITVDQVVDTWKYIADYMVKCH